MVGGNDSWCSRDIDDFQYLTVDLGKCSVSHMTEKCLSNGPDKKERTKTQ